MTGKKGRPKLGLQFIDRARLKSKMKEKELTQENVADYLQINRSTFAMKASGHSSFNEDEEVKLVNLLGDGIIFLH